MVQYEKCYVVEYDTMESVAYLPTLRGIYCCRVRDGVSTFLQNVGRLTGTHSVTFLLVKAMRTSYLTGLE
jgi:hypothetical protein